MAQATSYDLPQYVGELFQKAEKPNALLRLIGGLTGRLRTVMSTEYTMGVDYTLASASQPAILEGATPTASHLAVTQGSNVVQIFQEAVDITYSRMGASASIDGVSVIPGSPAGGSELIKPGSLEFQIARKMEKIARDANLTFLRGAYVKPSDNNSARKTRGIRAAITTNSYDNSGTPRDLTKAIFEAALKDMMGNGAFSLGETIYAFGDAAQVENLVDLYKSDTQLPASRDVVGVAVRTIVTTWANVEVVYEPDMNAGEIMIIRPEFCRVVCMPIPGKGLIFAEPLAHAGSSEKHQIYGELGIDYRHEVYHGLIDDLNA